jgi:hypothetical protein
MIHPKSPGDLFPKWKVTAGLYFEVIPAKVLDIKVIPCEANLSQIIRMEGSECFEILDIRILNPFEGKGMFEVISVVLIAWVAAEVDGFNLAQIFKIGFGEWGNVGYAGSESLA